jgi:IclR family acetate operon transcriptional repressor
MARPVMEQLAEKLRMPSHLGVLDAGRVVLIDKVVAPADFNAVFTRMGTALPAHTTAMGKVLLAYLPPRELQAAIGRRGLPRHTPHTITTRERLLSELQKVRDQGYAENNQEQFLNRRAIAAPVVDLRGEVRYALSVTGNLAHPIWKTLDVAVESLKATAEEISRRLRKRRS